MNNSLAYLSIVSSFSLSQALKQWLSYLPAVLAYTHTDQQCSRLRNLRSYVQVLITSDTYSSWNGLLREHLCVLQYFHQANLNLCLNVRKPPQTSCTSQYLHQNRGSEHFCPFERSQCKVILMQAGNMLTGGIPEFDAFSATAYLDVSHNKLNGSIPGSWLSNPNLRYFSAAFNRLSGSIPGLQVESSKLLFDWPIQCKQPAFIRGIRENNTECQ